MSRIEELKLKLQETREELQRAKMKRRRADFARCQNADWVRTVERSKRNAKQAEVQITGFLFMLLTRGDGAKKLTRAERGMLRRILREIDSNTLLLEETRKVFTSLKPYDTIAQFMRVSIQCKRREMLQAVGVLVRESPNLRKLYDSCRDCAVSPKTVFEWVRFYHRELELTDRFADLSCRAREGYRERQNNYSNIIGQTINIEARITRLKGLIEQEEEKEKKPKKPKEKTEKQSKSKTVKQTSLLMGQYRGRVF